MSQPTGPPRPRQVTTAAALIMAGSALVVLTVFDRVAGLHTLETRGAIEKFLAEPPGNSLGIGVQGVLTVIRTASMVAAGCATAAAILGYQVLRRNRRARVALSVLAVPLFVTGLVAGGFLSSIVAAAAVMLWLQPARDWFDGVTRQPAAAAARPQARRTQADRPTAFPGFGAAPAQQPPTAGWPVEPGAPSSVSAERPSAVLVACLLTWVFAGFAVLLMGASLVLVTVDPARVFDELHRQNPDLAQQGLTDQAILSATYVMASVIIGLALAAIVCAVLAFRRSNRARIGLVACASASVTLCLFAVLGSVVMLLPLAAGVVTLALLVRPDVKAWFGARPPA